MLAETTECPQRRLVQPSSSYVKSYYRWVYDRLRSISLQPIHLRFLELQKIPSACKHVRADSDPSGSESISSPGAECSSSNGYGHVSNVLFEQTGRSSIVSTAKQGNKTFGLVYPIQHVPNCLAGSSRIQWDCGTTEQGFLTDVWMASKDSVIQNIFSLCSFLDRDSSPRPNMKHPSFCLRAGSDSQSLMDAFLLDWGRGLMYAFPPFPLILKVLKRIRPNSIRVDFSCSCIAKAKCYTELIHLSNGKYKMLPITTDILSKQ